MPRFFALASLLLGLALVLPASRADDNDDQKKDEPAPKKVEAGKDNARLSGMAQKPIRWIVDDASKFTAREVRRGRRYDGILLDPPKFGRGPDGEVWRLEENLSPLLADCRKLLDENSRFQRHLAVNVQVEPAF